MRSTTTRRTAPLLLALALLAAPLAAGPDLPKKVANARLAFLELLETPDRGVPKRLLDDCKCIAILPNVIKGAFGWGGKHGRGVLACRHEGGWSPPIFVTLTGGSFGFQIGAQSTDVVLFFMTTRSVRSLLESRFTLGGDVSVAAGPLGRSAEAATDLKLKAEIYSYAKARGLFAGISLAGSRLAPYQKGINRYYGQRLWPDKILFEGEAPRLPTEARELIRALP